MMPVRGLRKWRRVQNLAAERRQKQKERTRVCCRFRNRETVAGRRMTRRAKTAWRREKDVRDDRARNKAERGTPKRQKDGERLRKILECKIGIKGEGVREQLQGRMRLKNERTTSMIYWVAIGLEIVKRELGISSGLQRIRNWTLCRGRPPPKRKKKLQIRQGQVM
jgi:hypothetical protein